MSRKLFSAILVLAAAILCLAGFDLSRASAQGTIGVSIIPNSACFNNDCRNFNWTGTQAYDDFGNPIPPARLAPSI